MVTMSINHKNGERLLNYLLLIQNGCQTKNAANEWKIWDGQKKKLLVPKGERRHF